MLPRASLSRTESSWLAEASGRSPDLVSERRVKVDRASSLPAAFPISDQWPGSRQLREHHSGGTARESHPLPYSPRFSGHLKQFQ